MKGRLLIGTESSLSYAHQEVMAQFPLEVQEPLLHHGATKSITFCYKEEKNDHKHPSLSPTLLETLFCLVLLEFRKHS